MRQARFVQVFIVVSFICMAGRGLALSFHSKMESIKAEAKPGQVINRSFELTLAKEEQATQFKVHVEDWWRSEDGKQSSYAAPGTLAHSCAPWVKLNPTEATIEPGNTLTVRVTVAVPEKVTSGGYWCALTVDEVPNPNQAQPEGVQMRFFASVSIGIFIYVSPIKRAATITDVQITASEARIKMRCDGNCPLAVEGRVEFLRPGTTKPVATAVLPRGTLLPEPVQTACFTAPLPSVKDLPSGCYLVRAILDIGLDHYIGVQKELEIKREQPAPVAGN